MQFSRQHQERLAVHNQLRRGPPLFKVWRGRGRAGRLPGKNCGMKAHRKKQNWQRTELEFHNDRESNIGPSNLIDCF